MPKYMLKDPDYLDLWKYFQEHADAIKESMFKSVTWIVGFAAAMLGFTTVTFLDLEAETIQFHHPALGVASCAIGVLLCVYALVLLSEFATHIRANWARAEECKAHVDGLDAVIHTSRLPQKHRQIGMIWQRMTLIVWLFIAAFVVEGLFLARHV